MNTAGKHTLIVCFICVSLAAVQFLRVLNARENESPPNKAPVNHTPEEKSSSPAEIDIPKLTQQIIELYSAVQNSSGTPKNQISNKVLSFYEDLKALTQDDAIELTRILSKEDLAKDEHYLEFFLIFYSNIKPLEAFSLAKDSPPSDIKTFIQLKLAARAAPHDPVKMFEWLLQQSLDPDDHRTSDYRAEIITSYFNHSGAEKGLLDLEKSGFETSDRLDSRVISKLEKLADIKQVLEYLKADGSPALDRFWPDSLAKNPLFCKFERSSKAIQKLDLPFYRIESLFCAGFFANYPGEEEKWHQWINENLKRTRKEAALNGLFQHWAARDPERVVEIVQSMKSRIHKRSCCRVCIFSLAEVNPSLARRLIDELPAGERALEIEAVYAGLQQRDPLQAEDFGEKYLAEIMAE